jgi:hypothetical protein
MPCLCRLAANDSSELATALRPVLDAASPLWEDTGAHGLTDNACPVGGNSMLALQAEASLVCARRVCARRERSRTDVGGAGAVPSQAGLQKTLNLPLPQVAVVGSQSSGKSSVLEALVRAPPTPPN